MMTKREREQLSGEAAACDYAFHMFKWLFEISPTPVSRDYWFAWTQEAFAASCERRAAVIAAFKAL